MDRLAALSLGIRITRRIVFHRTWFATGTVALLLVLACDMGVFSTAIAYKCAHFCWHILAFGLIGVAAHLRVQ